jgi:hypothetical protein
MQQRISFDSNQGTYVLEYDIRVNNLGDFSNGISTIQSMYAPEFSSHTKGITSTSEGIKNRIQRLKKIRFKQFEADFLFYMF